MSVASAMAPERKMLPDHMEKDIRALVRDLQRENPGYHWVGEDVMEELEEIVRGEIDPAPPAGSAAMNEAPTCKAAADSPPAESRVQADGYVIDLEKIDPLRFGPSRCRGCSD